MPDPELYLSGSVINEIAAALNPSANMHEKRATRDRVRKCVDRAFKKGEIQCTRRGDTRYCDRDKVLAWAVTQWPSCNGKLSFNVTVPLTGAASIFASGKLTNRGTLVGIPSDPAILREKFLEVSTQLQNVSAELATCRAELAKVTAERDAAQARIAAAFERYSKARRKKPSRKM